MKFWKRLQNPFALVVQGFVLGGIVFFAIHPESLQAAASAPQPDAWVVTSAHALR